MRPVKKRAPAALKGSELARSEAANLLGEFSALLQQLGSPADRTVKTTPFRLESVVSLERLRSFLEEYFHEILLAVELPSVVEACLHAQRGEARELLQCDRQLAPRLGGTPFAAPSRQVGRVQLQRMRPLRDDRTVRRYLAAVESGEADAWHPLVYGLTLAVYSLPLRQGLLFYARETLVGLAEAAVRSRNFADADVSEILRPILDRLPAAVESALGAGNLLAPRS